VASFPSIAEAYSVLIRSLVATLAWRVSDA
jgi:hypothetical protein